MAGEGATLQTLSADECWALLAGHTVGRLGICYGGSPDIFPVNYVVDGETIVFRTEAGTKLAGATLSAGVVFEVDEVDEVRRLASSVVVHGRAVEVEALADLLAAELLPVEPWVSETKTRWVRVHVDDVTGRRIVR